MIAFVVFQLAVQHLLAHRQYAVGAVIEDLSLRRDTPQAVVKQLTLSLGIVEPLERSVSDALRVVVHRGRNQIQLRVIRQRRVDDLLPAPETHHHMHAHRIVTFEARGKFGATFDTEDFPRQHAAQFIRRPDRILISAHEHAGMHHQEKIVRTCRRVGSEGTGVSEIYVVCRYRPLAGDFCLSVLAAQHVDMPRHMVHVPRVRTHRGKGGRRGRRPFRLI